MAAIARRATFFMKVRELVVLKMVTSHTMSVVRVRRLTDADSVKGLIKKVLVKGPRTASTLAAFAYGHKAITRQHTPSMDFQKTPRDLCKRVI